MQVQLQQLRDTLAPYPWAYSLTVLTGLLLLAWLANFITKRVLLRGLKQLLARTPLGGAHHDHQVRLQVIPRLAYVVPALVISAGISIVPDLPLGGAGNDGGAGTAPSTPGDPLAAPAAEPAR